MPDIVVWLWILGAPAIGIFILSAVQS